MEKNESKIGGKMAEKDQLTVRDRISKICEMETLSHSDSSFLKDPIYVQMSSLFWKGMTSAYYRKHDFVFQFFVENKKDEEVFNCLWELSTKNNKSELISEILITHLNSIRSSLFPLNGSSADTVSAKRRHEFL